MLLCYFFQYATPISYRLENHAERFEIKFAKEQKVNLALNSAYLLV